MNISDCITFIGLLLDIVGASFLAWGIVFRRPNSVVAEEGNWHQSSEEMIRSLKNSCDDFRNTVTGWGILCFGFLLQMVGLAEFHPAWLFVVLFLIIVVLLNFGIALVQQYKIEVAIEFILRKINYSVSLDKSKAYGFLWPYSVNQNEIIIPVIISFIDFPLYWDTLIGEGGRDRNRLDKFYWLTHEIALRYPKFELPFSVYDYKDFDKSQKNQKSLWHRALYWSITPHFNRNRHKGVVSESVTSPFLTPPPQ